MITLLAVVAIFGSGAAHDDRRAERHAMVTRQIEARGIEDPRVLQALRTVPRHEFVPEDVRAAAYEDRPLPIGLDQTISQPFIVATMTEAAELEANSRVLEIGTGSGYQAAVASHIAQDVFTIELLHELARRARQTLRSLGYENVHTRVGDGALGWKEEAPFDAILVTAAAEEIPPALIEQLAPGGRLVIPVGPSPGIQELLVLRRKEDGEVVRERRFPVQFVPLVRPSPARE